MGMGIKEEDLIHFEMDIAFYYKNCEVAFKKINQIDIIKITGISDFGNLLSVSRTFEKKICCKFVINYITSEIENIEKVYQAVLDKEFGMSDHIH